MNYDMLKLEDRAWHVRPDSVYCRSASNCFCLGIVLGLFFDCLGFQELGASLVDHIQHWWDVGESLGVLKVFLGIFCLIASTYIAQRSTRLYFYLMYNVNEFLAQFLFCIYKYPSCCQVYGNTTFCVVRSSTSYPYCNYVSTILTPVLMTQ